MRTIIAAAALAVAGTSASAAVYDFDVDYLVTSSDWSSVSAGDTGTANLVIDTEAVPERQAIRCSIFSRSCRGFGGIEFDSIDRDNITSAYGATPASTDLSFSFSSDSGQFLAENGYVNPLGFYTVDFDITGSRVEMTDPDVTPVPLPASGLMLLAGFAGLGVWRSRKTS